MTGAAEGKYEQHLRDLFASFSRTEKGDSLDREGVALLCCALRLPDPVRDRLLPRQNEILDFARFRAALLSLLAEEPALVSGPPSCSTSPSAPRLTVGSKKYGRRSRPDAPVDVRLRRSVSYPEDRKPEESEPERTRSFETAMNVPEAPEPSSLPYFADPEPDPAVEEAKERSPRSLKCALAACAFEIERAKSLLEQTAAERDKARADLHDANRRAALLAHEVDENHAKLEAAAKLQIERSERKRVEGEQRLLARLEAEREQAAVAASELNERISQLESEEAKLKIRLSSSEAEAERNERENVELKERISELSQVNARLVKEIKLAASERHPIRETRDAEKLAELERESTELREENVRLRDRNDELAAELEILKSPSSNRRDGPPDEESRRYDDQPSVNGVKRRGASPSQSQAELSCDGESPRINKLRKFYDETMTGLDATSPSGPSRTASPLRTEQFYEDQVFLMRILSIAQNVDCKDSTGDKNTDEPDQLQKILQYFEDESCGKFLKIIQDSSYKYYYLLFYYLLCRIKNDIKNINKKNGMETNDDCQIVKMELQTFMDETNSLNLTNFLDLILRGDKGTSDIPLDNSEINLHSESVANILGGNLESMKELLIRERKEKELVILKHTEKIQELEDKVESLKNMYDECEEYWSSKLKEEREMFDQEQQINDEKFTELMDKLAEYEEQYGFKDSKNDFCSRPLSTIDEKCNLEKQFNDLEDEFENFKIKSEDEIHIKDTEISSLKEKITSLESIINSTNNYPTIKEEFLEEKTVLSEKIKTPETIDVCDSFNDNVSTITSPIEYLWSQKTITTSLASIKPSNEKTRDYQNPIFSKKSNDVEDILNKSPTRLNEIDVTNYGSSYSVSPIQKPVNAIAPPSRQISENTIYVKKIDSKIDGKMLSCSELEEALQGRRKDPTRADINQNQFNGELKHNQRMTYNQENAIVQAAMLDIRCRQLQSTLRQHQIYTDALMQQTLANHRSEVGALRQKLAAADLLVRDLYVENCHLTGTIINAP